MVCQAASQTRFRALKHENGIAGKATIIVRVIACFQPLQNCQVCAAWIPNPLISLDFIWLMLLCFVFQAEYFRHLLKPVT